MSAHTHHLVADGLAFAREVAGQLRSRGLGWLSHDELVASTHEALLDLVGRFDSSRGIPFRAFAYARLRGAMLDEARRLGSGRHGKRRFVDVSSIEMEDPALRADDVIAIREQYGAAVHAMGSLPSAERMLVAGVHLYGREMQEVAASLGLSKSWGSRLHARGVELLRRATTCPKVPRVNSRGGTC